MLSWEAAFPELGLSQPAGPEQATSMTRCELVSRRHKGRWGRVWVPVCRGRGLTRWGAGIGKEAGTCWVVASSLPPEQEEGGVGSCRRLPLGVGAPTRQEERQAARSGGHRRTQVLSGPPSVHPRSLQPDGCCLWQQVGTGTQRAGRTSPRPPGPGHPASSALPVSPQLAWCLDSWGPRTVLGPFLGGPHRRGLGCAQESVFSTPRGHLGRVGAYVMLGHSPPSMGATLLGCL